MKGRIPAALGAAVLLAGAATAWADFTPEGSPYPSAGAAPYSVYAADFDGDARPDFAATNGDGTPNVALYLRQAGGGFAQEPGSPFESASSNGALGDFNGDGRPDLAVAGFVGEGLFTLLRNPGGGFTRETAPVLGGQLSAVGAGDFNHDDRTDLAVAEWNGGNISILLRNASNDGFTVAANNAAGTNPRQIAVADFNGDGNPDLAIANAGSANVTILLGNGDGTFRAEGAAIPVGGRPQSIVSADFDGNGRPDLAVSSADTNTVSILLRDGAGASFSQDTGSPVAVGAGAAGLAIGDFDRNGSPDIAVAESGAGSVSVLQRGAAGFTRMSSNTVEGQPSGVAVADFNLDGVADVVVSSLGTNSVTTLLSPTPAAPPPTATPTPTATPVRNRSVAAETESGKVLIKVKGKFVPLTSRTIIGNGSEIDARKGRVGITTSTNEQADFYDGIFKISQTAGLTTLTLSEKLTGCPKAKKSSATAAAKKPKTRKLWGDGKGKFRTKGQYAAATIRGTKWLVTDTCTTTVVKVSLGAVNVRDDVKRKTVIARKGKPYTARKKR